MSTRIVVDEDEPLQDVEGPPFEPRDVQIRTDKWAKDEFEIHDLLGRGKFGEVKRCVEVATGREFAAKFICAPRSQDKKDVEHEINIMKKLQHKRLIQLYDAFEAKSEMCLILEIIYGGELFDRVISEDFILTEKACIAFVRQICEGLEYMHINHIIHLDMKPENILCLTRTGNRIKIIDFGLAREFHPKKDLRVLFGTPEFMAPEVVQYEPINYGTDMWSVGVICYVLLSGLSPFMGDTDGDTLTNVIKSRYDFNYAEFDDVSDDARDMIAKLLVRETNKRLSATECLAHSWLQRPPASSNSPSLMLTKKRLKRFVYRRKWQKIVNAIIALRRMGFELMSLKKVPLGVVASSEELFGRDLTTAELEKAASFDIKVEDIQRALDVKTYDLNKRKASDSGYESVAVDKDTTKDFGNEAEGVTSEIEEPPIEQNNVDAKPKLGVDKTRSKFGSSLVSSSKSEKQAAGSKSKTQSKKESSAGTSKSSEKKEETTSKKSVMGKFGGLFMNHKEKEPSTLKKDKSKKDKSLGGKKNKDKEKLQNSLVKKDSMKRKIGPKPKEEVYVTPGAKVKDSTGGKSSSTSPKSHGTKSSKESTVGAEGNRKHKDGHSGTNGTGNGDDNGDDGHTPAILMGNVKNKRKLFENNGRAS